MDNDFSFHPELGQANAYYGIALRIGNNNIEALSSNLNMKGHARKIAKLKLGEKEALVLACNSGSLTVLDYNSGFSSPGLVQVKE